MTRRLGCLPDPEDARDLPLSAALPRAATPPHHASLWDDAAPVRDQGSTSSCVGQAVAMGLHLAHLKAGARGCPVLSARAAYRYALGPSRDVADAGTWLRACVAAIRKIGIPSEAAWAGVRDVLAPVSLAAAHDGVDRWGLRGYYRIPKGDIGGVMLALAAGLPVVGGWQVGDRFLAYDGRGDVAPEADTRGGHALCLHGYDQAESVPRFWGVNSWGVGWGRTGHFSATSAWVASGADLWALDVRVGS